MSRHEMNSNDPMATALATSKKYHEMFRDVESLSSEKLLHDTFSTDIFKTDDIVAPQWTIDGERALLVDVRSRSERNVSMISGAISLDEFKKNVLPQLVDSSPDDPLSQPNTIILYCTIGFRSGMEGRKLQNKYPFLFNQKPNIEDHQKNETYNLKKKRHSKLQVKNLDGILNFANALEASETQHRTNLTSTKGSNKLTTNGLLINPNTNQPTNRVHVYGPSWRQHLSPRYNPVVFSKLEFGWRGLGVLFRSVPCPSCSCVRDSRIYCLNKRR